MDFGDYHDNYLSVATEEGEAISQLLAGYIDIILKARKGDRPPLKQHNLSLSLSLCQSGIHLYPFTISVHTAHICIRMTTNLKRGRAVEPGVKKTSPPNKKAIEEEGSSRVSVGVSIISEPQEDIFGTPVKKQVAASPPVSTKVCENFGKGASV